MRSQHSLSYVLMAGLLLAVAGCSGESPNPPTGSAPGLGLADLDAGAAPAAQEVSLVYRGPASPIGNGVAQTWVELDPSGTPLAVGLTLSEKALENLPTEPASWVLPFHHKASATTFTHVLLDYNPAGHEPPGVYDVPHFDVHFYTIPSAKRLEIGPGDPGFDVLPEERYIPSSYMKIPGGVPQMGAHWVDLLAPEFNGEPFTRTYIWGSFDGQVIFLEPMITLAYLQSNSGETIALRQPEAYQRDGYYPTSYQIEHLGQPNRHEISLQGLAFHQAQ